LKVKRKRKVSVLPVLKSQSMLPTPRQRRQKLDTNPQAYGSYRVVKRLSSKGR